MKFHPVAAGLTRSRRCLGKVLDDLFYLLDGEFARHPHVVRTLNGRRRRVTPFSPKSGDLEKDLGIVAVHQVRQPLVSIKESVIVAADDGGGRQAGSIGEMGDDEAGFTSTALLNEGEIPLRPGLINALKAQAHGRQNHPIGYLYGA